MQSLPDLRVVIAKRAAQAAKLILALALIVMAAACATSMPPENFVLRPVASDDDSKRFTYGARVGRGGGSEGGAARSADGGGRQVGGGRGQTISFEQLREGLEDYMALTSYCTQGYFVYDETYNGNEYLLHGECQESKDNE